MRNRGGRTLAVEAKSVAVHDDGLKSRPSWQESYQSVG